MKYRIVEYNGQFIIIVKHFFKWRVLNAEFDWRWRDKPNSGLEFYHYKFDTLHDAEIFLARRMREGPDAWIAFDPATAKVVRAYDAS